MAMLGAFVAGHVAKTHHIFPPAWTKQRDGELGYLSDQNLGWLDYMGDESYYPVEQCSKPCLVGLYKGIYYPVILGL